MKEGIRICILFLCALCIICFVSIFEIDDGGQYLRADNPKLKELRRNRRTAFGNGTDDDDSDDDEGGGTDGGGHAKHSTPSPHTPVLTTSRSFTPPTSSPPTSQISTIIPPTFATTSVQYSDSSSSPVFTPTATTETSPAITSSSKATTTSTTQTEWTTLPISSAATSLPISTTTRQTSESDSYSSTTRASTVSFPADLSTSTPMPPEETMSTPVIVVSTDKTPSSTSEHQTSTVVPSTAFLSTPPSLSSSTVIPTTQSTAEPSLSTPQTSTTAPTPTSSPSPTTIPWIPVWTSVASQSTTGTSSHGTSSVEPFTSTSPPLNATTAQSAEEEASDEPYWVIAVVLVLGLCCSCCIWYKWDRMKACCKRCTCCKSQIDGHTVQQDQIPFEIVIDSYSKDESGVHLETTNVDGSGLVANNESELSVSVSNMAGGNKEMIIDLDAGGSLPLIESVYTAVRMAHQQQIHELAHKRHNCVIRSGVICVKNPGFKDTNAHEDTKPSLETGDEHTAQHCKETEQIGNALLPVQSEGQSAVIEWKIENLLDADKDLKEILPLEQTESDLLGNLDNCMNICKLINWAVPNTIDDRALKKDAIDQESKFDNMTLLLNSARAIGVHLDEDREDEFIDGEHDLTTDVIGQIIQIGLFRRVNLNRVPGLVRLLHGGESLTDFQKLSPEQVLIRWINHHLEHSGVDRCLTNFTSDVMDSEVYAHLLKRIAPPDRRVTLDALSIVKDNVERAEIVLQEAEKIDCRTLVSVNDVVKGEHKSNVIFVANMFDKLHGLKPLSSDEVVTINETREEETYRHWLNSTGVSHVNDVYSDLSSGVIIFQIYDIIRPGIVDWTKVITRFDKSPAKAVFEKIANCDLAVKLANDVGLKVTNLQGRDIMDANRKLVLGLLWQMFRSYTMAVLRKCSKSEKLITDDDVLSFANQKLRTAGKSTIMTNFKDPAISDGRPILDLIDAILPGYIDYTLVKVGHTKQDKLENVRYALNMARMSGTNVYVVAEDIVNGNSKMIMIVFASIMACDSGRSGRRKSRVSIIPKDSPVTPFGQMDD